MVTAAEFKTGMRHLAGAVNIIATQGDGSPAGMTATAVCSLTADPPMLLVCINRSATSHEPIRRTGRFSVNVLSTEDAAIAMRFAAGEMQSRFQSGEWTRLPSGVPALQSALVTFDCSVKETIPVETHSIFIARVEQVIVRPGRSPLLYVGGQYAQVREPLPEVVTAS